MKHIVWKILLLVLRENHFNTSIDVSFTPLHTPKPTKLSVFIFLYGKKSTFPLRLCSLLDAQSRKLYDANKKKLFL